MRSYPIAHSVPSHSITRILVPRSGSCQPNANSGIPLTGLVVMVIPTTLWCATVSPTCVHTAPECPTGRWPRGMGSARAAAARLTGVTPPDWTAERWAMASRAVDAWGLPVRTAADDTVPMYTPRWATSSTTAGVIVASDFKIPKGTKTTRHDVRDAACDLQRPVTHNSPNYEPPTPLAEITRILSTIRRVPPFDV